MRGPLPLTSHCISESALYSVRQKHLSCNCSALLTLSCRPELVARQAQAHLDSYIVGVVVAVFEHITVPTTAKIPCQAVQVRVWQLQRWILHPKLLLAADVEGCD